MPYKEKYEKNKEKYCKESKLYYQKNKEKIKQKGRERYYKNIKKIRKFQKLRYQKNKELAIQRVREWRKNNPEKVKKQRANWRAKSKEKIKVYNKRYLRKHPENRKKTMKKFYENNKEKISKYHKSYGEKLKIEILSYYSGGGPICACCGITEIKFLNLDHIKGRKNYGHKKGLGGSRLYKILKDQGFPPGYQVLCWNCNNAKWILGYCPHRGDKFAI